ncbi:MAG: hypothetical protein AAFN08_15550 [Cyanobacteria bacterium J06559_3]
MSSVDIRQQAISLLEHLPQNKLEAVVQLLEVLAEPIPQPSTNPEESRLIDIIQRQLPEGEATRLNELRQRCEWGELSEPEHQELIRYEDSLEQHRVNRLQALMELAQLRNLDLVSLNQQMSRPTNPIQQL